MSRTYVTKLCITLGNRLSPCFLLIGEKSLCHCKITPSAAVGDEMPETVEYRSVLAGRHSSDVSKLRACVLSRVHCSKRVVALLVYRMGT